MFDKIRKNNEHNFLPQFLTGNPQKASLTAQSAFDKMALKPTGKGKGFL